MIVKRGPHPVQLRNGYRWRRSAGSSSSRPHASHVARSGAGNGAGSPTRRLASMWNAGAASNGSRHVSVTRWGCEAAGLRVTSSWRKRSRARGSPSASIRTPRPSLRTDPAMPWRCARRYTNGRKPTPCTTPSTATVQPRIGVALSESAGDRLTSDGPGMTTIDPFLDGISRSEDRASSRPRSHFDFPKRSRPAPERREYTMTRPEGQPGVAADQRSAQRRPPRWPRRRGLAHGRLVRDAAQERVPLQPEYAVDRRPSTQAVRPEKRAKGSPRGQAHRPRWRRTPAPLSPQVELAAAVGEERGQVAAQCLPVVMEHADLRLVVHGDMAGLQLIEQVRVFAASIQHRVEADAREDLAPAHHDAGEEARCASPVGARPEADLERLIQGELPGAAVQIVGLGILQADQNHLGVGMRLEHPIDGGQVIRRHRAVIVEKRENIPPRPRDPRGPGHPGSLVRLADELKLEIAVSLTGKTRRGRGVASVVDDDDFERFLRILLRGEGHDASAQR